MSLFGAKRSVKALVKMFQVVNTGLMPFSQALAGPVSLHLATEDKVVVCPGELSHRTLRAYLAIAAHRLSRN